MKSRKQGGGVRQQQLDRIRRQYRDPQDTAWEKSVQRIKTKTQSTVPSGVARQLSQYIRNEPINLCSFVAYIVYWQLTKQRLNNESFDIPLNYNMTLTIQSTFRTTWNRERQRNEYQRILSIKLHRISIPGTEPIFDDTFVHYFQGDKTSTHPTLVVNDEERQRLKQEEDREKPQLQLIGKMVYYICSTFGLAEHVYNGIFDVRDPESRDRIPYLRRQETLHPSGKQLAKPQIFQRNFLTQRVGIDFVHEFMGFKGADGVLLPPLQPTEVETSQRKAVIRRNKQQHRKMIHFFITKEEDRPILREAFPRLFLSSTDLSTRTFQTQQQATKLKNTYLDTFWGTLKEHERLRNLFPTIQFIGQRRGHELLRDMNLMLEPVQTGGFRWV